MVSQSESNSRDRSGEAKTDTKPVESTDNSAVNTATPEPEYEHYSAEDPFRTERIAALDSALSDVHEGLSSAEAASINQAQAERIQKDAFERSKWPEAMVIQFRGALQLAKLRTPPRHNRIL